jgi:hypothetical protein
VQGSGVCVNVNGTLGLRTHTVLCDAVGTTWHYLRRTAPAMQRTCGAALARKLQVALAMC